MDGGATSNYARLDLLGWLGGAVSLTGYGLITNDLLSSTSLVFLTMNAVACVCLIYYTFRKKAFANTMLNSIYLLITMIAIARGALN